MKRPTQTRRLEVRKRPQGRIPVLYQNWRDLLFLHWEYDIATVQETLPNGLLVDSFEDRAYIGVIPFFIKDMRPPFLPCLPFLSYFLELNVRTYVYDKDGTPGIWFYSLDANHLLAVLGARLTYSLPYIYSQMSASKDEESKEISYSVKRIGADPSLKTAFIYEPTSHSRLAEPGTLDFFLIERYVLFSHSKLTGKLYQAQIHHEPYPLADVMVRESDKNVFALDGLPTPAGNPIHKTMSAGVNVEIFALDAVK
jgi:uncharacterized protein